MNTAKKPHVLAITPYLSRFGLERGLAYLLQYAKEDNVDYTVVYFEKKYPDTETSFLEQQLKYAKKSIHAPYKQSGSLFRAAKIIAQLIEQEAPDIIMTKEWFPTVATVLARWILAMKRSAKRKIQIIATAEISPEFEFLPVLQERLGWIKFYLYRWLYCKTNLAIAVSEGVKKAMPTVYKMDLNKIEVIYNGIDFSSLQQCAAEHPHKALPPEPVFIGVGRLEPEKGFDVLIQSFAKAFPNKNAHLVILGEGDQRKELERQIAQNDMQENIHLFGFVDNPFSLIARATAFVFSSRFEGFPFALIEAMAVGAPVVSTRCRYGADEALTEGEDVHGWLVDVEDVEELAYALQQVLAQPEQAKEYANKGQAYIKKRFTVREMSRQYHDLFKRRLSNS